MPKETILGGTAYPGTMEETLTVTQLNTRVKALFNSTPGVKGIWVTGEISNLKLYTSGHYYFTLKDSGSEVRGVMFKYSRGRIDFEPADNMKVTAFGSVDMYVDRGSYQFVVETMKRSGLGELYEKYEALKKKLEAEGLFDAKRKRKLPAYPKVVGVVTSPTGAVIHDIITTSARRFPADILLAPAMVQGEGASASIAAGIALLNKAGADVIIVGRGGGSIEDLWAFNEETTARAIAASAAPVISAVGHETDFTISDMVADVRAPTPTGAAQIALKDLADVGNQLDNASVRLGRSLLNTMAKMRARFDLLDSKLSPRQAQQKVAMQSMRLENLSSRMAAALGGKIGVMRRRFDLADSKLEGFGETVTDKQHRRLENASGRLDALSPYKVLDRGYSMVTDSGGRALTSASSLREGSDITVRFRNGSAEASVKKVRLGND